MILHLCVLEKFTGPFYQFTKEHMEELRGDHKFYVNDLYGKFTIPDEQDIFFAQSVNVFERYSWLVRNMYKARKIILHGLWDMRALAVLCFNPWLLKKCYWAIWGGDLYVHKQPKRNLAWRRNEALRQWAIRRIGHFITHLRGDYELARKWYGATGRWHDCFMYPSNLQYTPKRSSPDHEGIKILLGNSADQTNNHIDVIEKLKLISGEGITIFCPLSYGHPEYANKIAKFGREKLGDRFIPIMDYLPLAEYRTFLEEIDIAIFNHQRQQGMGIATTLLGLGKKVYMRRDISSYRLFKDLGAEVFPVDDLVIEKLSDGDAQRNRQIVEAHFSRQRLIDSWKKIYE